MDVSSFLVLVFFFWVIWKVYSLILDPKSDSDEPRRGGFR